MRFNDMFKKRDKNIILSDEDILHSLNYNIILKNREYPLTKENILYSDYRIFNHQKYLSFIEFEKNFPYKEKKETYSQKEFEILSSLMW